MLKLKKKITYLLRISKNIDFKSNYSYNIIKYYIVKGKVNMKEKEWKKWLFWFSFVVASIVVYKTIDSVSVLFSWFSGFFDLIMPFFMAVILAYMLYIPSKKIETLYKSNKFLKKRARGLSVLTTYFIVGLIIFITINFIIPTISTSITDLFNSLPNYYNSAIDFFKNVPKDSIWAKLNMPELIKELQKINFSEEVLKWFKFENVGQYIKGIVGVTGIIFDAFVTIVVSVYLLLERNDIKSFIKKLSDVMFDKETYKKIKRYYEKTNSIFYSFVSSQVIDAFIIGIICAIAMIIMKVKYGALLGFLIGLFNIIPYFGAIFAVTITIIITIFTGGFMQALWVALVIIVLQQIDANIINPRILGTSLNLSPILVIFAVTVGGAYFGVLGMFLGVPIAAFAKIIVLEFIENHKKISENKNS